MTTETKTSVWNAGIDAAHKYLRAYRETQFTNTEIQDRMTDDAKALGFSEEEAAEVAECGFKYLVRNHWTMFERLD